MASIPFAELKQGSSQRGEVTVTFNLLLISTGTVVSL